MNDISLITDGEVKSVVLGTLITSGMVAVFYRPGGKTLISRPTKLQPPTIEPGGGTYIGSVQVELFPPVTGAIIRYTLNDTEATLSNGFTYSLPIVVSATTKIRYRAYHNDYTESDERNATYTIGVEPPPPPPPTGEINVVMSDWEAEEIGLRYRKLSKVIENYTVVENGVPLTRQRRINYHDAGDSGTNTPGSGKRKKDKGAAYVGARGNYIWPGPTDSLINGHVRRLSESPDSTKNEPDGNRRGEEIYIAAEMCYVDSGLSASDKLLYARQVVLGIIDLSNKWWADFRNNTLWPQGFYGDVNPIFFIACLLANVFKARDLIRGYWHKLSATDKPKVWSLAERQKIDTWLFNYARWYDDESDYPNGMYRAPDGSTGYEARKKCLAANQWQYQNAAFGGEQFGNYTHLGGYNNSKLVLGYSNRRGKSMSFMLTAAAGLALGHDIDPSQCYRYNKPSTTEQVIDGSAPNTTDTRLNTKAKVNALLLRMIEHGELWVIEHVVNGAYPDGMGGEFYRGSAGDPEQGWNYAGTGLADLNEMGYILGRLGRRKALDFVSSAGLGLTVGGQKSLKQMNLYCARMHRRAGLVGSIDYNRYAPGSPSRTSDYLIDGIAPTVGKHYVLDGVMWPMVLYLYLKGDNDYQEMKDVMLRNRTKYPNLQNRPSNTTGSGIGPFPGNNGGFCAWPGGQEHRGHRLDEAIPRSAFNEIFPPTPIPLYAMAA